jgi:hypothetical protein
MESCVHGINEDLVMLSRFSNRLGWDSFNKVRVSSQWLIVVCPLLFCRNRHLLPQAWGYQFTGNPVSSFELYALMDPDALHPHHQCLLDTDFETLGSGPTLHSLFWLADVNRAIAASALSQAGTLTPEATAFLKTNPLLFATGQESEVA